VLAPLIGLVLGYAFKVIASWSIFKTHQSPASVDRWSRIFQLFSAAAFSLGHGGNDAQKTMGIITSALFAGGLIATFKIPLWVVLSAHTAIALGTLSGGWRIVKTMGQKITRLRPVDGVCAESAAAISIYVSTFFGVPVSTTHVITGAISGVGSVNRRSAVRWNVTLRIVWAWLLTIPCSALIGGFFYSVLKLVLPK
jgi:inorganic phosphate transporter, PiT family